MNKNDRHHAVGDPAAEDQLEFTDTVPGFAATVNPNIEPAPLKSRFAEEMRRAGASEDEIDCVSRLKSNSAQVEAKKEIVHLHRNGRVIIPILLQTFKDRRATFEVGCDRTWGAAGFENKDIGSNNRRVFYTHLLAHWRPDLPIKTESQNGRPAACEPLFSEGNYPPESLKLEQFTGPRDDHS